MSGTEPLLYSAIRILSCGVWLDFYTRTVALAWIVFLFPASYLFNGRLIALIFLDPRRSDWFHLSRPYFQSR